MLETITVLIAKSRVIKRTEGKLHNLKIPITENMITYLEKITHENTGGKLDLIENISWIT